MYGTYDIHVSSIRYTLIKGLSVLCRDRTIINKWGGKLTTLKFKKHIKRRMLL